MTCHYVEHGTGRPVLVLHGAGVDHRETEACFEPAFDGVAGLRRIYPDLPGMGRTIAPETMRGPDDSPAYAGPTVVVAGRLDSTVGYAAAADLLGHYQHASLAVVDDAGHALPHEQPELLRALLAEWLARVERSS